MIVYTIKKSIKICSAIILKSGVLNDSEIQFYLKECDWQTILKILSVAFRGVHVPSSPFYFERMVCLSEDRSGLSGFII